MAVIGTILVIFFTILNLVIYHRMVIVFSFDLRATFTKELIGSLVLACFETALIMYIGAVILIVILIIIAIIIVVIIIKKVISKKNEAEQEKREAPRYTQPSAAYKLQDKTVDMTTSDMSMTEKTNSYVDEIESVSREEKKETMFCPFCGNSIKRSAKFCNFCGKENRYGG